MEIYKGDTMKRAIVVMSGKGGVGKSTVATDLAIEMNAGILDVDVMAPNAPTLIGGEIERPLSATDRGIAPAIQNGLEVASLAYDMPDDTIYAKTGEFKYNQLKEYIDLTQWQSDTVIVDSPPGTGTETRTVLSKLPQAKAIVVSTGRDVSISDCRRSIKMLLNSNIDILGVIENFAYYKPPDWLQELIDEADPEDLPENTQLPLLGNENLEEHFKYGPPHNYTAPVLGRIPYQQNVRARRKNVYKMVKDALEAE